ncbi:hypothetical protein Pryu01_02615 [Paraliobacillus ryukyuensis]|uniref:Nucleotidyltransferase-like protein n=1 Tax=Paraliobacillus ryukyuensis TaxID=200904 RepID=A0A366EBH1_9BACI|nr:nucleotidyltransferase domain-containing protein [Paraliobacillus ryukyuensis]RBO99770.1 hypothetical protein DES48_10396 [Paraliobacillus ryukyuensis]
MERKPALEAAKQFVHTNFSTCEVALLAGSVARNEATATSDLDIVIIDDTLPNSYRESVVSDGWPIEVFAHNSISYQNFYALDAMEGKTTLARMVADGIIIRDNGTVKVMKQQAYDHMIQGPAPWSAETIKIQRYELTDLIDDLQGAQQREEEICIVLSIASTLQEFYLRINRQWVGGSKWIYRELKKYDASFAATYIEALEAFYQQGDKQPIIALVDQVLAPYGGRLFDGFSLGKE